MISTLAKAARFEFNERLRLYPALIQKRRIMVPAAVVDTECWHRIACSLETRSPLVAMLSAPGYTVLWSDILTAIDQAERTRTNACGQKPEDLALARRRDAVIAIAAQVRPVAQLFIAVMAQLRAPTISSAAA